MRYNLICLNFLPLLIKVMLLVGWGGGLIFGYKATLLSTEFLSVRQAGMGHAYTAIANDETLLQANPAGLALRKLFQQNEEDSIFYFLPLKYGLSTGMYKTLVGEGAGALYNPDTRKSDISIDIDGLMITDFVYAGDFWGLSIFSKAYGDIFFDGDVGSTYFDVRLTFQLNVGFHVHSFSFLKEEDFHIGIGGKFLYLGQINKYRNSLDIYNSYSDWTVEDLENITSQTIYDIIFGELNFFEGFGIGLDFGVIWEIPIKETEHQVNIGLMLEDFPTYGISSPQLASFLDSLYEQVCESVLKNNTNSDDETITRLCKNYQSSLESFESTFFIPNVKLGVAYMMPNYLGNYFRDTIFALDLHRIGTKRYGFADVYHLGVSSSIFDFTDPETGWGYRMNLSVGINQNQLNLGVLFHLKVYEIGYNYYSKKLIERDASISRHVLTLTFYF